MNPCELWFKTKLEETKESFIGYTLLPDKDSKGNILKWKTGIKLIACPSAPNVPGLNLVSVSTLEYGRKQLNNMDLEFSLWKVKIDKKIIEFSKFYYHAIVNHKISGGIENVFQPDLIWAPHPILIKEIQ